MTTVACVALGGCNTVNSHIGDEDPLFGEAAKYNAAIQTINPDPVYDENGAVPGDSGAHGAEAIKRYRTDKVSERHRQESRQNSRGLSTTGGSGGSSTN
jgi:hypothetical protein